MGNLDQTLPGSIDNNPSISGDILGVEKFGIQYITEDLKNLNQEKIKNLQADIKDELDNPGADLIQRISTILQLAGIKSTPRKSSNPEGNSLIGSTTTIEEIKKIEGESMDGKLRKANDAIRTLTPGLVESLIKDIKLTDLTEEQKNLLATQQGTTPEKIDLTSPATQSLIEVFTIDKNKDQIREAAIKNGKSAQEVQDIFTTWGMKMNEYQIPVSGSIDSSLKGIPKKIAEPVKSTYQEIVGDKTPPTVTRTGDRLTFSDPRNERYSYEIDMSKQPPRLAKTRNGLSISRNIEALSEEKKELQKLKGEVGSLIKERTTKQPIIEKHQKTIESVNTDMIDTAVTDGKNPELKQSLDAYKKSKAELNKMDGKSKIEALNNLESARSKLFDKRGVLLNSGSSNSAEFNVLEKSLEDEAIAIRGLRDIENNINIPLADQQKKLDTLQGKTQETGDDGFENNANYNLTFLSKIGYDGIGQDNMERIIRALNSSQNPSRSSVGEINLNQKLDTPKTQALTLAIANLVRNGRASTGEQSAEQKKTEESQKSYDNVDKNDPYIAARQTQSLGFRESLSSVARNMSQEGGSLKTNSAIQKVLFGINPRPEASSAINTKVGESPTTQFA